MIPGEEAAGTSWSGYASKVWIKWGVPMTLSSNFLPALLGSRGGRTYPDDLDESNFCYKFWESQIPSKDFKSYAFNDKPFITEFRFLAYSEYKEPTSVIFRSYFLSH